MKSLKYKILKPLMLIIILIPLVSIVVLNVGIRVVERKMAKDELKNIIEIAENKEKVLDWVKGNCQKSKKLSNILLALQSTKFNTSIEYIIFDTNYNNIDYTINTNIIDTDTFLTDDLISNIQLELPSVKEETIRSINIHNEDYLYTMLKSNVGNRLVYVVLISKIYFNKPVIIVMNIIFVLIATLSIIIALTLIYVIIHQLTKPINDVCYYSNMIGKGKFVDIPINDRFTEIYQLTSQMNDMSKQLSKMNKAQKDLIQNISHEFRTPLTAIASYAEGMKLGVFKDIEKASSIIMDESQRINILVEQILTLSRIENVNYTYDMEDLILNNCLLDYVQSLQAIAIKENKCLDLKMVTQDIIVKGNDMLLSQVIYNTITNCLRYAVSKVTISLIENDTLAEIVIRDDGCGFADEDLPHIFDRFYKGKKGKFGLGLAIAKSSAELMGGKIKAKNSENGATFVIKFPIV